MKIAYFSSLPEQGKSHVCSKVITVEDFLNGIKYGEWRDVVEKIRLEKDKKKRDQLKKSLPSVTMGGVFKERKEDKLVSHSGFICVDIDQFNDRSSLVTDPYTFALFKSVSGNGIAIVVKVNPDKHKESYRWLENYYFSTYGISVDPAPKNVASLRYVTYDPEVFINSKSRQSKTKSEKAKRIATLPVILPSNQVEEMIAQVVSSRIDIAPDYETYLRLGFALASGFGEEGRHYFHQLCSTSEKYNSQQCDKQYDRCISGAGKSGVSVGTFYWLLKDAGVTMPKTNSKAVQVAAMGKKSGRTQEAIETQLVQINGLDPKQAKEITEQVFERDDINLTTVSKDPDQLITSLIEWINQNHPVRINQITKMIEESPADIEVNRARLNTIYLRARMVFNSKEITKDLVESIIFSDLIPEFNPITEYIDTNRHRNTSGNIDALIKSINTDTEMAAVFIRKWLISIVAAYDGHVVRLVLALVGGQHTGKTEFFRRLLPRKIGIGKYYGESRLDAGKDDELLMTQKLVLMDDELGGKSKNDEKRFKELTSKHTFSLRAPYARNNEDFKRLAVLCGTSNDRSVINDPTGNTRVLPVNIISIDHEAYNGVDKDELFMELVRTYEAGEEWHLTKEEMGKLSTMSEEFESIPFERELITQFFKAGGEGGGFTEWLMSTEIKDYIESSSKQRIMNSRRFGLELAKVLGKSEIRKKNGIAQRVYQVIRLKQDTPPPPAVDITDIKDDLPF